MYAMRGSKCERSPLQPGLSLGDVVDGVESDLRVDVLDEVLDGRAYTSAGVWQRRGKYEYLMQF